MLRLRYATPPAWTTIATGDLDAFLRDHAANERKVSHSALTLAVQHYARSELVAALIEVAQEELEHFRLVFEALRARGGHLGPDMPDPYTGALHRQVKHPEVDTYLLRRLVLFAVIEARGHERFAMLTEALDPGPLKQLYAELTRSEARHHALYLRLARQTFGEAAARACLDWLLDVEAEVIRGLPLRAALH